MKMRCEFPYAIGWIDLVLAAIVNHTCRTLRMQVVKGLTKHIKVAMHVRLLLADDHVLIRQGLKALIEKENGLVVVGEADNGMATVKMVGETSPHVVIMDVAMPDLNGIEATRKIVCEHPQTKVIALSGHANKTYVREMLSAGASAYVLKNRAYEELVRAVQEVMQGRKYLSPDIARGVIDDYVEMAHAVSEHPAFTILTSREREILQQVAEGRSTKETADTLGVSVKTVETHRRNIMEKLDLHSVAELTKYAVREGVSSLDT
jgi:DNA-binding NarL/FixJ family response regulator